MNHEVSVTLSKHLLCCVTIFLKNLMLKDVFGHSYEFSQVIEFSIFFHMVEWKSIGRWNERQLESDKGVQV